MCNDLFLEAKQTVLDEKKKFYFEVKKDIHEKL